MSVSLFVIYSAARAVRLTPVVSTRRHRPASCAGLPVAATIALAMAGTMAEVPHSLIPLPVMPSTSRNIHKSGVSPSTSTVRMAPLTLIS